MNASTEITVLPRFLKPARKPQAPFGYPREFFGNRFVYAVISPRAKGLSIGVNMNPDRFCDFDCAYCEVNRSGVAAEQHLDVEVMAGELQNMLANIRSGKIRESSFFNSVPNDLLHLRHVTLSGDGEPTLSPNFSEAVQAVMHVRACDDENFFKVVLVTNASGLDRAEVQDGLKYFTRTDEIWAKLDAGTQTYMERVNRPRISLDRVCENILSIARHRPVVIQSLFPMIAGQEPSAEEIHFYAGRLRALKDAGAQISMVQIYSATRPTPKSQCGHLPLRTLSRIAQKVKETAGLKAEVF